VTVVLAFVAAFLGALTVVTQHVASTAAAPETTSWRLAVYLFTSPLWLVGVLATVGSFAFQAFALYGGRLSVVQSIMITELVFSLLIGRVWLRRRVRPAAWTSAAVASVGLAVFLIASEPKGGHPQATTQAWLPALAVLGGSALVCVAFAGRGTPRRRGALYAVASGIVSALLATFIKSAGDTLAAQGGVSLATQWTPYALIVTAVVSAVLTQAALHHGPLAVSQPLMVIVNPFASVGLGVWLYGEHFTGGALRIGVAAAAFAAIVIGVMVLANTAPSFTRTTTQVGVLNETPTGRHSTGGR
jgi:drug/metabolite transporter (DMT)-like permease